MPPDDPPPSGSRQDTPRDAVPDGPSARRLAVAAIPAVFIGLWSTGFIFAKLGMPSTEPATFLTLRFAIVLVLMLGMAVVVRAPWPAGWRPAAHSVVVGVLLHGGYLGGVFAAIAAGVPAGVAALVVGIQPLLTATLVGPVLGERVTPMQWLGLVLGLAGITLVLWQKLSFGEGTPAGYLYAAGALVGITLATLYQKRYASNAHLITGGVFQYGGALLVVALAAAAFESFRVEPSWDLAIALLWLSIVLSVVSIWLLMVMIRRGAAGRVASLFYMVPPLTALIAWPVFGETLGMLALAGMALAAAGVALVNR
jgi:drug/metabolite transporter (DMT)-like permease